jgi:hypothetical protein
VRNYKIIITIYNLKANVLAAYHFQHIIAILVHVPAAHKLEGHSLFAAV